MNHCTPRAVPERARRLLAALSAALLLTAGHSFAASVPTPQVTPVPVTVPLGDASRDYPQMATQLNLARYGYLEQEFFFQGTATRYQTPALATGSVISSGHPYKTRMIVRRPASNKRFNGTVIVEWLNVTSGFNLDALWLSSYDHLLREGYAYVGVSAQRVGVQGNNGGLTTWSPRRYGGLDVTDSGTILDDSLSYDIFSQAAQAMRAPGAVNPLGNLVPRRVIATGASQSESYLVRYHNSVHPLTPQFDGYLLYLGTGGTLRTDLTPKVLKVNTENDVLLLGEYAARQPDSEKLRIYEVAGTSHVGFTDPNLRGELLVRDNLPTSDTTTCDRPALSHIPTGHVLNASFDHLLRWINRGIQPPTARPLVVLSTQPVTLARDAYGNAQGGIQLPEHAVATATNTGLNSGPGFCFLLGSHEPFDDATLKNRYWTHGLYVAQVTKAVAANLKAGYITPFDGAQSIKQAVRSDVARRGR